MSAPETKWCSGHFGHWECADKYPDHWLPVGEFDARSESQDGLQNKCRRCKSFSNSIHHPESNPLSNAISARAIEKAGGRAAYDALPKRGEERKAFRAEARAEIEAAYELYKDSTSDVPPMTIGGWLTSLKGQKSSLSQGAITVAITERSSSFQFPAEDPEPVREDFGPRTPMTRRETGEITGEKTLEGHVYVVRNPDTPQYMKIGSTHPYGIPDIMTKARRFARAELVFKCEANHAEYAEKKIAHVVLREHNLRNKGFTDVGKEVFEVTPERAIEVVKMACEIVNDPEWKVEQQ